ncbi:Proline--tRNA ligase [Colletotrichum spinosum]|uniref:Proline--tRNA ligase n=1 Tax=Colletotrichum spinosum TaxID=1347390 RepID=A0A4R8PWI7_9PEZI|nr:Proline--tRNA ligase [Colletotrichum spinosum]
MKDLYTFDVSREAALETYSNVQTIYAALFDALKLPIMVAQASSGDMGGDLSHEYHLPTPVGEDTIIACNSCAYAANAEVAQSRPRLVCDEARSGDKITAASAGREKLGVWRGISKDRLTLVNVWFPERIQCGSNMTEPRQGLVSIPAIQSIVPDLDTSIDNALQLWADAATATVVEGQGGSRQLKLVNLVDVRLESVQDIFVQHENMVWPLSQPGERKPQLNFLTVTQSAIGEGLNLLAARTGDACPCCKDGVLTLKRALEVGHTFHLGSRYSEPLGASITLPIAAKKGEGEGGIAEETKPMQMGCHGIGVSRLIGAVVEHLADDKGLQWPRAIAPYEVVLVPTTQLTEEGERVYDELALFQTKSESIDVVLDDRRVPFGWKMRDADLVGYPVVVVIGRAWKEAGRCELQCRRLGVKETVALDDIRDRILELLRQL